MFICDKCGKRVCPSQGISQVVINGNVFNYCDNCNVPCKLNQVSLLELM